MGGESSMTTVESGLEVPTGSENELLRIRGAQLCLIDGEESVIIQSGDFAFHVIKQSQSPLAAVVGLVGDFQWPVGKDSPVIKVGTKKYSFALSRLPVYGLVLPGNTPVEAEQSLEGLLQQYSTFETHPEVSDGIENSDQTAWLAAHVMPDVPEYWTTVAPKVESISAKIAQKIHSGSSSSSTSSSSSSSAVWSEVELSWSGGTTSNGGKDDDNNNNNNTMSSPARKGAPGIAGQTSTRMMKRIQQARRMSAVAKLLSKTLLRGAINANRHVAPLVADLSGSSPMTDDFTGMVVASVDAFSKVVEAVETGARSILDLPTSESLFFEHSQQSSLSPNGPWTLNKSGLRLLLRATAASAVIHVARGIGVSSFSLPQPSQVSDLDSNQSESCVEEKYWMYSGGHDQRSKAIGHFIPTPNSSMSNIIQSSTHRGNLNSPFQQYVSSPKVAPGTNSQFNFSLAFDNNSRQAPSQHQNM